jgi:uncharacterized protein (DUF4415 family)
LGGADDVGAALVSVTRLKRAGSGYQTRINAILRSYMKAQSE